MRVIKLYGHFSLFMTILALLFSANANAYIIEWVDDGLHMLGNPGDAGNANRDVDFTTFSAPTDAGVVLFQSMDMKITGPGDAMSNSPDVAEEFLVSRIARQFQIRRSDPSESAVTPFKIVARLNGELSSDIEDPFQVIEGRDAVNGFIEMVASIFGLPAPVGVDENFSYPLVEEIDDIFESKGQLHVDQVYELFVLERIEEILIWDGKETSIHVDGRIVVDIVLDEPMTGIVLGFGLMAIFLANRKKTFT